MAQRPSNLRWPAAHRLHLVMDIKPHEANRCCLRTVQYSTGTLVSMDPILRWRRRGIAKSSPSRPNGGGGGGRDGQAPRSRRVWVLGKNAPYGRWRAACRIRPRSTAAEATEAVVGGLHLLSRKTDQWQGHWSATPIWYSTHSEHARIWERRGRRQVRRPGSQARSLHAQGPRTVPASLRAQRTGVGLYTV